MTGITPYDTQAQLTPAPCERTVEERLRASAYLELRFVRGTFHDGVLTLTGRVSSYYLWQLAQAAVRDVEGVATIDNRIEVIASRPGHVRHGAS